MNEKHNNGMKIKKLKTDPLDELFVDMTNKFCLIDSGAWSKLLLVLHQHKEHIELLKGDVAELKKLKEAVKT